MQAKSRERASCGWLRRTLTSRFGIAGTALSPRWGSGAGRLRTHSLRCGQHSYAALRLACSAANFASQLHAEHYERIASFALKKCCGKFGIREHGRQVSQLATSDCQRSLIIQQIMYLYIGYPIGNMESTRKSRSAAGCTACGSCVDGGLKQRAGVSTLPGRNQAHRDGRSAGAADDGSRAVIGTG